MEQILLPSPSGHSEWELEQKAALGFILLDVDKGATILKKSRESLESVQDFQQTEKELISFSLDGIFQENALCLDNLFLNSRYPSVDQIFSWDNRASCPVLQWEMPSVQPHDIQLGEPSGLFNLHGNLEQQLVGSGGPPSVPVSACTQHCKGEELPVPEEEVHHQAPAMLLNLHDNPEERNCFSGPPSNTLVLASPLGSVGDGLCLAETHLEHEVMSTCFLVPFSNKGESQGLSEEPFCLSEDNKGGVSPLSLERESLPPVPEDKGSCLASVRDLEGSNSTPLSWQENYISISHDCSAGVQKEEALGLLLNDLSCGAFHTHGDEGLCRSTKATEQDPYLETLKGGSKGHLSSPLHHPLSTESKVYKMCPDGETSQEGSPYGSLVFDQSGLMEVKRDLGLSTRVKRGDGLVSGHCLPADAVHDRKILYSEPSEARLLDTPELALDEKEGHGNVDLDASGDGVYHERYCSSGLALCLDASSPCSLWTSKQTVEGLSPSGVEVPSSLPVGSNDFSMDEDLSPLKVVFDALDQDRDGFVRIEEFVQFATAYGAEQVKHLTRFLDPSGLGVISFEDFYRGIAAIGNGDSDPQLYDGGCSPEGEEAGGCPEEYEDYSAFEQNEVTDSAYLGSESAYSECETFTDEDTGALPHPELHEEVETDSAIDGTLHDTEEAVRRLSLSLELNSHSLLTVLGRQEEHFEDFGEGQDSELLPESPDRMEEEGDNSPPESILCSSLLLSPSADPLPASFQGFLREGALGFFCSQCCKQISRLEDLSTRLNSLEMNSTSKTLSSRKVARHLHQSGTLTLGSIEDLSRDILELGDTDITDKVMFLERRVSELEKDSSTNEEQHTRLRQENLQLVHRSNAMEEQLKEQEMQAEEALQLELRRRKDAMGKLERERAMELENLLCRLQQLDEENSELRSCVPCLRANIERLEEEKRKLQEEVEDVAERLGEELESRRKLSDELSHERHKSQMEKECTQELIEDLRKQLEHLQLYKLEMEARRGRSASAGLQEYQNRTREAELEQEIRRLKQDNRSLKEQNDELNGQIINLSIQGAKNLFGASFSESLAAEISSVSRDELMEAIHKQEDINYRLQDYIDRIIVSIMESSPSILEVK